VDKKEGAEQERGGKGAGDAVEQRKQHTVDVVRDIGHYFLEQVGRVPLEEVTIRPAGDAAEKPDPQPMAKAVSITSAGILGD